jgi:ubiquinone/menaquinone biosynthesis C-methylase UbiE
MEHVERHYIPAAGHHWSLPLYDPLTRLIGADRARKRLLEQAGLRAGDRVLDVGCGTGSLAVLAKRTYPNVYVTGLDPDPRALGRAARKAERAGLGIQLDRGFADALPYPDAWFDRVFSSFMFHHLSAEVKTGMLREVRRVLKPGGRLELLDFAGPDAGSHGFLSRLLHSHELMRDNALERVIALMRDAGFTQAFRAAHGAILVGHIAYYQATRASDQGLT